MNRDAMCETFRCKRFNRNFEFNCFIYSKVIYIRSNVLNNGIRRNDGLLILKKKKIFKGNLTVTFK